MLNCGMIGLIKLYYFNFVETIVVPQIAYYWPIAGYYAVCTFEERGREGRGGDGRGGDNKGIL